MTAQQSTINKPSILFAIPPDNHIYQMFIDNLKYCGFEVIDFSLKERFDYPDLISRLKVKFKQTVLRQKNAKHQLKEHLIHQHCLERISHYPQTIDYALFIRPDAYGIQTIRSLKQHIRPNHVIAYQWDGMNNFPEIWQYIDLFDRFFVFDPKDLNHPQHTFLPTTNFYFDHDLNNRLPEEIHDFYYIGSHELSRLPLINQFCAFAKQHNWQPNIMIYAHKDITTHYPAGNIKWIKQTFSLQENLNMVKQSRVLLDFVNRIHNGLSLRVFEALAYRKKLITTNAKIVKYDFYSPQNIYVLNEHNLNGLPEFLAQPYCDIDPQIREKYSFSNWIKYVLNIEPHQQIRLPEDPLKDKS